LTRRHTISTRRIYNTTAYRYPNERLILALTLLLVLAVIVLTATATVCLSALFIIVSVAIAYGMNRYQHNELLSHAQRITPQSNPGLAAIAEEAIARLQPGDVQVFVAPSRKLNAYTFGILPPKIVVLNSALLQIMDADELRFILGHELGHVRLGHTWLNSLVGGMAGIPSPIGAWALLTLAFRWWNRACEHSADRAGMLACGEPHKALMALIKLEAGPAVRTHADLERALRVIDAEDDNALSHLEEALGTHPMMIKRITQLRRYAASAEYRRLQEMVNQNVQ
jgi:Zn-dependent protease with chaperone function